MKKIITLILVVFLIFGCSAKTSKSGLTDGTFTGSGKGKNGDVTINITIKDNIITNAEVKESKETAGYNTASDVILQKIIESNSLEVDGVTGATYTSNATFEAVKNALAAAGGSATNLVKKESSAKSETKEMIKETHKIVVVGAGGAGMIAAIEAKLNGTDDVIIIEKMPFVGGNTLISGAEMAAPGNDIQIKEGIKDSPDLFYEDVLKGGGDPALIRVLADNSLDASKWLTEEIHVVWEDELMFFGGHSVKRSLIPLGARGSEPISKLKAKVEELKIPVYTNVSATELIVNDKNEVIGVKAEGEKVNYEFETKAVILATGGFGNNIDMRKKYDPTVDESILSTNAKGIDGDGIIMASNIGAELVGMEHIQLYPVCHPTTGALLYVDDARLMGMTIMVNKEGKRFVEELNTRYVISMAVKAQTGSVAYELMTKKDAEAAGVLANHKSEVDDLMANGFLVEGTLEEVAKKMDVDYENLKETVKTWNTYVKDGSDPEFNKRGTLYSLEEGPYWLLKFAPAVHHTMGGVKIDTKTHVINTDGNIIKGLYAAGEVTGGIHGNNRLGSAAIADITVFGRIAGQTASEETK